MIKQIKNYLKCNKNILYKSSSKNIFETYDFYNFWKYVFWLWFLSALSTGKLFSIDLNYYLVIIKNNSDIACVVGFYFLLGLLFQYLFIRLFFSLINKLSKSLNKKKLSKAHTVL